MDINYAVAKGKIVRIWKEQKRDDCLIQGIERNHQCEIEKNPMIRGSNGTYREIGEYLGTKLYVSVHMLSSTKIVLEGQSYCIPRTFTIECYKDTSKAIGHKAFGNLAILNSDMDRLKDMMAGKIIDVMFAIKDARLIAVLPYRVNGQPPFFGEIGYADKEHTVQLA